MKKNILLAEQAAATIGLIKEMFSGEAFELTVAPDGETAVELLDEQLYDLVITEAMLPRLDGFNLSLHAKNRFPAVRVVLTSGVYKGIESRSQAINQYQADDFFEKPFDAAAFKRRCLQLLNLTEADIRPAPPPATPSKPVADTNKIPTLKTLEEEENKLTSEDLFGDIIASVQEPSPAPPARPPAPPPSSLTQPLAAVTQKIPTSTQPAAATPPPAAPRRPAQPPVGAQQTQRLSIGELERLLRPNTPTPPPAPARDSRKKIEDDINQRLEETISGLGLKPKSKKESEPPAPPPPTRAAAPTPPPSPVPPAPRPTSPPLESPATILMTPAPTPPTAPIPTPAPAFPAEEKKDEVGGYEIIGLIARGGMAEIYKAKRKGVKGFEKVIALKKILSGYGKDDKYIEMFVDEAKIAAELSHPNIVPIYDLGKQDDYYFIAMEYVAGKDLRLILRKLADMGQLFPEYLSIYMIIGILDALNHAHNATDSHGRNLDIVHRDVSPPNILISYTGDVKLTDFGVSKASIKMHHTVAGALKGKLLYMSPEQARADKDIDYRSDLYSAGIILFELLTGKKLFLETSEMAVLQKVQAGEIIRPGEIKKDIHPQLEAIVLKMLQKDKEQRYAKGADIIQDLHEYLTAHYSAAPTAIHLSHAICALFKEEIRRENQRVDIKPLPYRVEKLKTAPRPATGQQSAAAPSPTPPRFIAPAIQEPIIPERRGPATPPPQPTIQEMIPPPPPPKPSAATPQTPPPPSPATVVVPKTRPIAVPPPPRARRPPRLFPGNHPHFLPAQTGADPSGSPRCAGSRRIPPGPTLRESCGYSRRPGLLRYSQPPRLPRQ